MAIYDEIIFKNLYTTQIISCDEN